MKNSTTVKLLSLLLAFLMLASSLTVVAFATGDGLGANYSAEDDMTPENLGDSYSSSGGVTISNLQQFKFADAFESISGDSYAAGATFPVGSSTNAIHGGHHTRILRTNNGTYAVIITRTVDRPNELVDKQGVPIDQIARFGDDHPYWINGYNYYSIVKLTPKGVHVIHEDICPENDSSHVPEIYAGEGDHIYVIYPGEDPDAYYTGWYRYYMTGDPTGFNNAGYLILNEIDTATDTLIRTKKAVIPFDTNMLDDHGYGKPSAVVDLQARKIYCIYDGGYGGSVYPAYFAWFIYDLDTNEWEPTCHTLNIEHRKDYYNLYPDGNGGAIFIIQRCVVAEYSPEIIGVQITGAGFAWDSVYYYHIKDMEAVNFYNSGNLEQDRQHDRELYDYVEYPISVPDYQLSAGKYYPITASHYGNNGCTYRDTNGNIHVIYTESYPKKHPKQSTTTYHVIMDTSTDTEIFREMIPTSLLPNNGAKSGYDAGMGFTMTQGPDGKFYIFHFKTSSNNVQVEVFSSPADDGRNFTKAIAAQFLTTRDGTKVTGGYPIIGNSRDGSIRDGIIPMIFNSSTNPASGSTETYYYFSVEVPCSHCWSGWEVTVPPTATDAGEETRTCSFCGATETRPISGPVCTASLSLNDSVDINIYVDNVTADLVSDGYSVEYGPDGDKTQVAFSAAEPVSEGRYKFTVASFNANQLSRNVYLNVLDGSGQPVKFIRYSVKDYCDTVLNDPSADEGLQNVCSALMAYGWYAQERFPEGKGPDFDPEPYSDAISAVEALGIEGMGDYETHAEYSSLVSGVSASLVLKSKTDLNFFIKGVSDVGDITLTVDGHNWTDYEAVTSETKCRITVRGLSPVVYASDVILVCEGANVTYSPMAYLKRVVESGESDCINVCKALYLYAAAAMNFFNP